MPIGTANRAIYSIIRIPLFPHLLAKSMRFTEAATAVGELKLSSLNQESIDLCFPALDGFNTSAKSLEATCRNVVNELKS